MRGTDFRATGDRPLTSAHLLMRPNDAGWIGSPGFVV